ncbi:neural cell adhesion molecule 1b isoform X2 [Pangasianodon hypophthalmus]|uniref:neural cell adhesion molecule 1b isoform X2 n=1 Tax=Pangasianodon hypophthalmus TaxID=310915 RepID=UPI000F00A056|nr:neural cell adhesion molecule 1b isoform X2 [Pangasianodon hypophthalmus]
MRDKRVMAMFLNKEIILIFLFLGNAASLQVSITPAQGEVSVGESKFFLCEVVGAVKGIDWFSPSGEKIESNRQDITVIRNDDTSSTLTIYNANIENAGTYKCVATSGDQQAEATVNVKIYQKITFKNSTSPQEFTEGDDAVIVCDVISSPPPTVMWKHKRAKIQFDKDVRFKILDNNHLQIRGIRKADEGVYTCEARIMARGEIDFRDIRVVVNVVPTIRVRQAEVNATADISHSAMLACDADGFPEPTITWTRSLRSEVLLESGDKYSFNEDGSEITIMDVKKLDEGDYTCIARNKAGTSEEEVSLRVFVKPKITYLENQTTTEMEEQIRLTCEATGDPTPSITWSFGTHVFAEGEQASWTRPEQHKSEDGSVVARSDARVSSLTLKYVQYTDAGQYLCTASNAVGQSSQSTFLEVRYAPKILGSVAVYTWEGNPANISCEILAHPSDVSIMWLRDGLQLPNANSTNVKIYTTPTASYLQVNPDSQNDFGSYNCTASNEIGTESKEFILIQADVPSAPTITRVEPYSSTAEVLFDEPEASGGVPVLKYRAEWRAASKSNWVQRVYEVREGLSAVTITGLKPDTKYEVKVSAINGKGEGESSSIVTFKTEPVREPSPPKLEGALQSKGNALKVKWIKQDDGGSPITHYLIRYKAREDLAWKDELRVPSTSGHVLLSGLDWNTEYDVMVVAENQQGKSQPGSLNFRTSSEPSTTPDYMEDGPGLSTGLIVGILILVCVVLLLAMDATCCFVNKCGLLMCLCGKPGTGPKGKDVEAGKAAFVKDDSKEPIVEMRTEDGLTANHDVGGHAEPNETTPLTEPEQQTEVVSTVVDLPLSLATNSDTVTDTFDLSQSSPVSESTTLTSSLTAPPSEPKSTPKTSSQPLDTSLLSSDAPLVDLADSQTSIQSAGQIKSTELDTQAPPSLALSTEKEARDLEAEPMLLGSPCEPRTLVTNPQTSGAPPSSEDLELQIDGGASLTHFPQDGLHSLATAASTDPSAPQNEKILEEDEIRAEEDKLKKVQPEALAEPNAVSQTNASESKA